MIRHFNLGTILSLLVTLCFTGCLTDDGNVGLDDLELSIDTSFVEKKTETFSRTTGTDTLLNEDEDSVFIVEITEDSIRTDSSFNIITTKTLGSQSEADTSLLVIPVFSVETEKKTLKSYPVDISTEVTDIVMDTTEQADTTLVENDTLLLMNVRTTIDSIITTTHTNQIFDISQGRSNLRTLEQEVHTWSVSRQDTLHLAAIIEKSDEKSDTLICEEIVSSTDIIQDFEKTTEQIVKQSTIIRKVIEYKYITASSDTLGFLAAIKQDTIIDVLTKKQSYNLKENMILATTTDYSTGSFSAISLDGKVIQNNVSPIHSDAFVRFFGGDDIYIVNSFKRDNIQVLDRKTLETTLQFPLPALSNPHDLDAFGDKLYVTLFGENFIAVYDKATGKKLDEIDISEAADENDSLAEAHQSIVVDDKLFVITQNVDNKNGWNPLDAHLIQIDLNSNNTEIMILPKKNPSAMVLSSDGKTLFISCRGSYGEEDGAILRLDTKTLEFGDHLLEETDIEGDLSTLARYKQTLVFTAGTSDGDVIFRTPESKKEIKTVMKTAAWSLFGIAVDEAGKKLYAGDRINGLRIFNLNDFKEADKTKISTGLPIKDLAVIR